MSAHLFNVCKQALSCCESGPVVKASFGFWVNGVTTAKLKAELKDLDIRKHGSHLHKSELGRGDIYVVSNLAERPFSERLWVVVGNEIWALTSVLPAGHHDVQRSLFDVKMRNGLLQASPSLCSVDPAGIWRSLLGEAPYLRWVCGSTLK
jgi:hypothetical protein